MLAGGLRRGGAPRAPPGASCGAGRCDGCCRWPPGALGGSAGLGDAAGGRWQGREAGRARLLGARRRPLALPSLGEINSSSFGRTRGAQKYFGFGPKKIGVRSEARDAAIAPFSPRSSKRLRVVEIEADAEQARHRLAQAARSRAGVDQSASVIARLTRRPIKGRARQTRRARLSPAPLGPVLPFHSTTGSYFRSLKLITIVDSREHATCATCTLTP